MTSKLAQSSIKAMF
ncbi:hypothetical protein [Escherichia coli]|nr:hypothetical protein [Escherichia coli]MBB9228667.1 hypothetical protein [Escherichia coli]MBL9242132.1 hypothetical protein [Escherichia coli]